MYYCPNCGCEFELAEVFYETHGLLNPPFEKRYVCPCCKNDGFYEKTVTHCRCCGRKLNGKEEYCSKECEINGKKLWQKDRKRRGLNLKSPVNLIIKELQFYNQTNRTNYSYGQYVALIRPTLKRGKRK